MLTHVKTLHTLPGVRYARLYQAGWRRRPNEDPWIAGRVRRRKLTGKRPITRGMR
jgi:hypothetical protein